VGETTDWNDGGATPNHTYIFQDKKSMKVIGYIPVGGTVMMFNKPLMFDRKKRTFVEVKP
jgi:hypothetical protein